jgi:hypothetical protein
MPGSLTTPGRPSTRGCVRDRVAFRLTDGVGTRGKTCFVARWLAYAYPCQRFALHLAMHRA